MGCDEMDVRRVNSQRAFSFSSSQLSFSLASVPSHLDAAAELS
jgi:hypothetical protein